MPTYEYQCDGCGSVKSQYHTFAEYEEIRKSVIDTHRSITGDLYCGRWRRVISSPSFHRGMQEHYNPSVGSVISTPAQFRSQLSAASDAATERTGTPHNFQPIDPRDPVAAGVTEAGMDSTYAAETKAGIREAKKYL